MSDNSVPSDPSSPKLRRSKSISENGAWIINLSFFFFFFQHEQCKRDEQDLKFYLFTSVNLIRIYINK